MTKLLASVSYSFNNFYDNLNSNGRLIFSLIVILLLILFTLLLVSYIIEKIKNRKKVNENVHIEKKEQIIEEKDEKVELYTNEKTEIEDIAERVESALKEDTPITLTSFEEDQERTAIISIDELMKKAKELEIMDDEEREGINYLEKYNIEPSEAKKTIDSIVKPETKTEVKAFKVSQVISPIYGVKKDISSDD